MILGGFNIHSEGTAQDFMASMSLSPGISGPTHPAGGELKMGVVQTIPLSGTVHFLVGEGALPEINEFR